jgi:hypothetical protein
MALVAMGAVATACSVKTVDNDDDTGNGGTGGTGAVTTGTMSGGTMSGGTMSGGTLSGGTMSGPTTTVTSSSGGGMTGICGTTYSYNSAAIDKCITDNCCVTFDPCAADEGCVACLTDPMAMGCDENALWMAYETCKDTNCTTEMCDTGIGFSSNMGMDPNFSCNACGDKNCCTELDACVGDLSQAAKDLCILCLNMPNDPGCNDATVKTAAEGFNTCIMTSCAAECG